MLSDLARVLVLALLVPPHARSAEAPPEVRAWLAGAATPVATLALAPEHADLAALKGIVGDARIVLAGEATHGSHEFFAFKARLCEYLVSELGFTDFAMETDWVSALQTNEWVEHGTGDLAGALTGLAGLWRTEEYRALLEWMRAWNADPAHARKVRIHGMDMQAPQQAAQKARAYLERVQPELAADLGPLLERACGTGPRLGQPTPAALAKAEEEAAELEGVLSLFDELREELVAASSPEEWARMRQCVVIVAQGHASARLKTGLDNLSWRDRCMADNVRWILRQQGAGARILVSAHNGHVSRDALAHVEGYGPITSIGRALVEDGRTVQGENLSLVAIGGAFARGGFRAYPASGGGGLTEFTIEEPEAGSIEAELLGAGLTQALVHLAGAPKDGPVRAWLDTPRPMRGVGGVYDPSSGDDVHVTAVPSEFDALFFVAESSPAHLR